MVVAARERAGAIRAAIDGRTSRRSIDDAAFAAAAEAAGFRRAALSAIARFVRIATRVSAEQRRARARTILARRIRSTSCVRIARRIGARVFAIVARTHHLLTCPIAACSTRTRRRIVGMPARSTRTTVIRARIAIIAALRIEETRSIGTDVVGASIAVIARFCGRLAHSVNADIGCTRITVVTCNGHVLACIRDARIRGARIAVVTTILAIGYASRASHRRFIPREVRLIRSLARQQRRQIAVLLAPRRPHRIRRHRRVPRSISIPNRVPVFRQHRLLHPLVRKYHLIKRAERLTRSQVRNEAADVRARESRPRVGHRIRIPRTLTLPQRLAVHRQQTLLQFSIRENHVIERSERLHRPLIRNDLRQIAELIRKRRPIRVRRAIPSGISIPRVLAVHLQIRRLEPSVG